MTRTIGLLASVGIAAGLFHPRDETRRTHCDAQGRASLHGRASRTTAAAVAGAALAGAGCQLGGDELHPPDTRGHPSLVLEQGPTRALVMLPDAEQGWYRGTRFAWHGMIRQLEHHGHTYFGYLHDEHDPTHHDAVSGPAPEFDITGPASFHEVSPGQSFVKIGVGRLERDDNERYRFWHTYRILDSGQWEIEQPDARSVVMRQTLELGEDGYAYELTQRMELMDREPDRLAVTYELHNTGQRAIATEFYHHNFFNLGGAAIGPGYELRLPFPAEPDPDAELGEYAELDSAGLGANAAALRWRDVLPDGEAVYLQPQGFDPEDREHHRVTLLHHDHRIGVLVLGDRPLHRLAVWASQPVICPEPFVMIEVEPGQTERWATVYVFLTAEQE